MPNILKTLILGIIFKLLQYCAKFTERVFGVSLGYQFNNISEWKPLRANFFWKRFQFEQRHFLESFEGSEESKFLGLNPFGAKLAIIIQGDTSRFSAQISQMIKRYRVIAPDSRIIISTWENSALENLESAENVHIIRSSPPSNRGVGNVNLQLVSTQAGLKLARDLGCEFIFKTRTDQYFANPQIFKILHTFYLLHIRGSGSRKFIVTSLNTFCFRTYSISDMVFFGSLEDMQKYWGLSLDVRTPVEIAIIKPKTFRDWVPLRLAENYMSSNYIYEQEGNLEFSLIHYYETLNKYFCVVDAEMLGQSWSKYTHMRPRTNPNVFPQKFSEITYSTWLSLGRDSKYLANLGARFME